MKAVWELVKVCLGAIGGTLSWYFGNFDGLFIALLGFILADYITGLVLAYHRKELSSEQGFKGFLKKCVVLLIVGIANLLDVYVIKMNMALRSGVIVYYLANEGLSILENSAQLGLPIPEKLKETLAQLHNKENKENGDSN